VYIQDAIDLAIEGLQHLAECDRLLHGSRETVEQNARLRVGTFEAVAEHRDRDFVRHQRAPGHEPFGAQTERRPVLEVLAKEVARRHVLDAQFCLKECGLSSLSGTRGAE
jgi:hypothetical protein